MSEIFDNNWSDKQTRVSEEIRISIEKEEQKLIKKLWDKLGISKESALALSELKTIKNKNDLRKELERIEVKTEKYNEEKELNDIEDILNKIKDLRENIHTKARIEIASLNETLREKLEKEKIDNNTWISGKIFSKDFIQKAIDWDKFAWIIVWWVDSTYRLWVLGKDLLVWLVKLPSDLYKLATKKAEYNWFKDI